MKTLFLALPMLILISTMPAFAQYGPVSTGQIPIPSQLQQVGKYVNSTGITVNTVQSWSDTIIKGIQGIINGIIGSSNLQPNTNPLNLTTGKLQNISNSSFTVFGDVTKTGFDLNKLIFYLFQLSPWEIPLWIIIVLSSILTIVILIKFGKVIFEKGAIIIGIILFAFIGLLLIGIHSG